MEVEVKQYLMCAWCGDRCDATYQHGDVGEVCGRCYQAATKQMDVHLDGPAFRRLVAWAWLETLQLPPQYWGKLPKRGMA